MKGGGLEGIVEDFAGEEVDMAVFIGDHFGDEGLVTEGALGGFIFDEVVDAG